MDARAYLKAQGWRGDGHSLDSSDRGIRRPLLVSKKVDVLGVGVNKHAAVSDQWWMRAYDSGLKDLGTGKKSTLATVREQGMYAGGLYGRFVKGEGIAGTFDPTVDKSRKRKREGEHSRHEPQSQLKHDAEVKKLKEDVKRREAAFILEAENRSLINPLDQKRDLEGLPGGETVVSSYGEPAVLQVFRDAGLAGVDGPHDPSSSSSPPRSDRRARIELKQAARKYIIAQLRAEERRLLWASEPSTNLDLLSTREEKSKGKPDLETKIELLERRMEKDRKRIGHQTRKDKHIATIARMLDVGEKVPQEWLTWAERMTTKEKQRAIRRDEKRIGKIRRHEKRSAKARVDEKKEAVGDTEEILQDSLQGAKSSTRPERSVRRQDKAAEMLAKLDREDLLAEYISPYVPVEVPLITKNDKDEATKPAGKARQEQTKFEEAKAKALSKQDDQASNDDQESVKDEAAKQPLAKLQVIDSKGTVRYTVEPGVPVPLDRDIWKGVKIKSLPRAVREAREEWLRQRLKDRRAEKHDPTRTPEDKKAQKREREALAQKIVHESKKGTGAHSAVIDGIDLPLVKLRYRSSRWENEGLALAMRVAKKALNQQRNEKQKALEKAERAEDDAGKRRKNKVEV